MGLSFKDYVTIADALEVESLDEGWKEQAFAKIKQVLGGKMSDDEIDAEIEKVKAKKAGVVSKVKDTQQSKDFHQRRADAAAKAKARQPQGTQGTVPNTAAALAGKSTSLMRGGELRAVDRNPFGEGLVTEAQKEYKVEYTTKAGGSSKFAKIKAQDVTAVREKFRRDFHGMKILTVTPAKVAAKKTAPAKVEEDFGPLGPRTMQLDEATEANIVVMKVSYDYITRNDREKTGTATMFHTCKSPEEAQALKAKIEAEDELEARSPEDTITKMGQNSYNDFDSCHGDTVYATSVKVVAKEPTGSKVFFFDPKEFYL